MPGAVGKGLAWAYERVTAIRNGWYDVNAGKKLDRPVVSIGNLSAGGTGKTPMVIHLVGVLKEAKLNPAIAMRGYKAPGGNPAMSDEAQEYSRALPLVPLAVGKDRAAELKEMFTTRRGHDVNCVLLDDGFQHRQLFRDLDIVLIDATRSPFADRQLPAGLLREPVTGLKRAHAVVITHAQGVSREQLAGLAEEIRGVHGKPPLAMCRHVWRTLVSGDGPASERNMSPDVLRGKRVAVACAIGNPAPLLAAVRTLGEIVHALVLPDHDPFGASAVKKFAQGARDAKADVIVVTEKDWSKLRDLPANTWPCPVLRPRLALSFSQGEQALSDLVVGTIKSWRKSK
ncbi:MAG: tetraacyldisaccharide 4'-kinase [Planctomycetota bacterium]